MSTDKAPQFDPSTSRQPVYAPLKGGFAIFKNGQYVWLADIPAGVSASIGDAIPHDWGVRPANEAARADANDPRSADESLVHG